MGLKVVILMMEGHFNETSVVMINSRGSFGVSLSVSYPLVVVGFRLLYLVITVILICVSRAKGGRSGL